MPMEKGYGLDRAKAYEQNWQSGGKSANWYGKSKKLARPRMKNPRKSGGGIFRAKAGRP